MDIEGTLPAAKKTTPKKSIEPPTLNPPSKRFSFSRAKQSFSPAEKPHINFLSLFLEEPEIKAISDDPKHKSSTIKNPVLTPINDNILSKMNCENEKSIQEVQKVSEINEEPENKKMLENAGKLNSGPKISVQICENNTDFMKNNEPQKGIFNLFQDLLVPPIMELNIKTEIQKSDEKQANYKEEKICYLISLGSAEISISNNEISK